LYLGVGIKLKKKPGPIFPGLIGVINMEQYLIIGIGILLVWGGVLTGYIIGARSWDRNNRRRR